MIFIDLLIASLGRLYHMLGQLPIERVTPDLVFNKVGVDYAGPIYLKYGFVRKPTIIKAYLCVFVSLSVKPSNGSYKRPNLTVCFDMLQMHFRSKHTQTMISTQGYFEISALHAFC